MNLLVSYAYIQRSPLRWCELFERTRGSIDWMFDSGAFSAKMSGHIVRLDRYIDFVRWAGDRFYGCVALDEVRNFAKSQENLAAMHAAGVRPWPVLTVDGPEEAVVELRKHHEHLCIAGGASARDHQGWYARRLNRVHELCGGDVKLHGLGYCRNFDPARRTPVHSVDASTWAVGTRYGRMLVLNEETGVLGQVSITKDCLSRSSNRFPPGAFELFTKSGITVDQLAADSTLIRGGLSWLAIVGVNEFIRYAMRMEKMGVKVFLALPGWAHLDLIIRTLRYGLPRGGANWRAIQRDVERMSPKKVSMAQLSVRACEAAEIYAKRLAA